ncbi:MULTISPECIES: DNA methyltransferase [Vreelandella]|uniref:site-specific DNA-methyltransferase (adenine-specific) n=2 Tax=Vreelandella TaxID=3137766 RepID=A0A3S1DV45_9GAMM|nr:MULTISPECIES: DNA methyltransferase [Halomonas]NYS79388.1 class I SAM-dependent DNA methyltransferase [Halomonas glaciei]RUR34889.1 class I SAM-dependent DNA methyltransferase [Halomonas nanhaiensis]|tara:strand:- start:4840 stop:7548 length:2709 start_codon:yes stop_codon:yes gene_type:complete
MAISQARIIESMEQACSNLNPDEFIFSFLDAYGFPKSTITRLRKGDDSRNVASGDDIGLKKKLYFRSVPEGTDLNTEADSLKASEVVPRNDIRFVIVTDFKSLVALDLKAEERLETTMDELDKQYAFFLPLAGYEKAVMYSEHPADVKASEKMGRLFDLIRERNDLSKPEDIHALNVFLTRLLFCFYAEDTGIFAQGQMTSAIQSTTQEDGSDVDQFFSDLFTVLNLDDKAPERASMAAHFQEFPYVNGGLFEADEPIPEFGRKARRLLIDCGSMDWSEINPDIFGSMFQAVIDEEQRGSLGQHYTSVSNIMKVIQPLFLDKLYTELEKSRKNERKLKELLLRLQNLRIFDPACGSGNFLIIAYKELRKLEMEIIDALNTVSDQTEMYYSGIKLSQFHGIEIDDFAHEIAILSLWLAEHQMNVAFKAKFGYSEAALPLKDSGNIACGNALKIDWASICPAGGEVYLCGNPPFIGDRFRTKEQSKDLSNTLKPVKSPGKVDFVAGWFFKASRYMSLNPSDSEAAFVATNSIFQGVQANLVWGQLLKEGVKLNFAHSTFKWSNNAKKNAGVHVAILGFSHKSRESKHIYSGEFKRSAKNISPYLIDGPNMVVKGRSSSLNHDKEMVMGNYTNDGGYLIFSEGEKDSLLEKEPGIEKWIREIVGAAEFLNGKRRYCLWLVDATEDDINSSEELSRRVESVRVKRLSSSDKGSQKQAERPHLFREQHNPGNYVFMPQVSSERRDYIPIDILGSNKIPIAPNFFVDNGGLYEFGILTSEMHNDWMRAVAGRLESRYRYSPTLVYNTFPWPNIISDQRNNVESLAETILILREDYPDKSLSQLYDPKAMPEPLREAHKALDRAVENLYRDKPFKDATERLEYLFARYEKLIAEEKAKKPAKKTAKGSN